MNISTLYINNEGSGIRLTITPSDGMNLQVVMISYKNPSAYSNGLPTSEIIWRHVFTSEERISFDGTLYFDTDGESDSRNPELDKFLYVSIVEDDGGETKNFKTVATFWTKPVIDQLMTCINELDSNNDLCASSKKFANTYLQFKAVSLAIRSNSPSKAEEYYYRFFSDKKRLARGGCNCHA